ncbi:hypothetical protein PRIPAC_89518 [Pristionchus pacificus]|uniref:Uncharacterized protein n=1 Tax=Pristionchus pacificus TaxID=54126 RepID=A0A2A6B992_PRIPA|nr:hypothetical protein PRIPAC_89518 [Pristionchus pacificus]|eukprot:PDM62445.1 hypothetical protein PRIPAC_51887 [Pristionchus pacificus]
MGNESDAVESDEFDRFRSAKGDGMTECPACQVEVSGGTRKRWTHVTQLHFRLLPDSDLTTDDILKMRLGTVATKTRRTCSVCSEFYANDRIRMATHIHSVSYLLSNLHRCINSGSLGRSLFVTSI